MPHIRVNGDLGRPQFALQRSKIGLLQVCSCENLSLAQQMSLELPEDSRPSQIG